MYVLALSRQPHGNAPVEPNRYVVICGRTIARARVIYSWKQFHGKIASSACGNTAIYNI